MQHHPLQVSAKVSGAPVIAHLIMPNPLIQIVAIEGGYGLLPGTLSLDQVSGWTSLKKTKVRDMINDGKLETAKVDGRTLVTFVSVIDLIERNRVRKGRR